MKSLDKDKGSCLPASLSFRVCHEHGRYRLATKGVEREQGAGSGSRKREGSDIRLRGPCLEAVGGIQVQGQENDIDWVCVWYLAPRAAPCGADP